MRMRSFLLVIVFLAPSTVHAAPSNPGELDEGPFPETYDDGSGRGFKFTLLRFRTYSADRIDVVDSPARQRYLLVGDALAGSANTGKLTLGQKISLSEYEIR